MGFLLRAFYLTVVHILYQLQFSTIYMIISVILSTSVVGHTFLCNGFYSNLEIAIEKYDNGNSYRAIRYHF